MEHRVLQSEVVVKMIQVIVGVPRQRRVGKQQVSGLRGQDVRGQREGHVPQDVWDGRGRLHRRRLRGGAGVRGEASGRGRVRRDVERLRRGRHILYIFSFYTVVRTETALNLNRKSLDPNDLGSEIRYFPKPWFIPASPLPHRADVWS